MKFYTKRDNAIDALISYFKENDDIFAEAIEELDAWNGYLGDDRAYDMDMLEDVVNGWDAIELLNRACFGHDEGDYNSSFNPNRDYFWFNGYGNLVSSDYKDYSAFIDEWAINEFVENWEHISTLSESSNDEMLKLFVELAEATEETA